MAEGKKGRKVGRNALTCKAYETSQRRELNKARRIIRHLKRGAHAQQPSAWTALEKLGGELYSAQRSALGLTDFMASRTSREA